MFCPQPGAILLMRSTWTGYRQRSQTTTTPPGRPSAPGRTLTRPSSTHALLARAVSDPDWRTASQALDDLMRKLLVVHRLLEAEEHLAKHEPRRNGCRPVRVGHRPAH